MKTSITLLLVLAAADVALAAQAATQPSPATAPAQAAQPAQSSQSSQSSQQRASQQSTRRPTRETYSDRYGVLAQRNIFLKDRSRPSSGGGGGRNGAAGGAATQPARRPVEETLLLRGIVVEEGEVRAYFEDVVNSRIVRVAEGDTVARGRITTIGLDAVEYEPQAGNGGAAAKPTIVIVGHDLTGKLSALDGSFAAGGAGAAATTGPVMPSGMEGINPNDPNLTMEQRLKLRRMQELKK